MALTHMQYDEIMREYEKKREVARHNAEEAKRTVEKAVPEYRDIEDKITEIAILIMDSSNSILVIFTAYHDQSVSVYTDCA